MREMFFWITAWDSTIYFPTLEQYRCNPAMVISGNVNDKVFAMATGKITDIQENEETGCTVIQDLGDGYAAVYGQLKELKFCKRGYAGSWSGAGICQ